MIEKFDGWPTDDYSICRIHEDLERRPDQVEI